jgi:uncharacterized protein YsxB (DUF464 family)
MIRVVFFSKADRITGFHLSGHAGYAESGEDIVCAAVSSAAYMTANTVTEILHLAPEISVDNGEMRLMLKDMTEADRAADLMSGFRLHMEELREQYPDFINVTITEV